MKYIILTKMQNKFEAISFTSEEMGKTIKKYSIASFHCMLFSSKKKHVWNFNLDSKRQIIELAISYISGKIKVQHNTKPVIEAFEYVSSIAK